mgnify:CR=1 FL=1
MKIVILSRKSSLYSTTRLVESITKNGHQSIVLDPTKCVSIVEKNAPIIYYGNEKIEVDAIIPRIGASVTLFGSSVIRQFENMNVFTTCSSLSLTKSRDKLRCLQILSKSEIDIPRTAFANHPDHSEKIIETLGGIPLIIKLLEGTQGLGVVLAETKKSAMSVIQAFYGLNANILVQEYIKESNGNDVRIFVIDNKVVGAIKRISNKEDFRSNLHRGGTAESIILTEQEKQIAIKSAKALGLKIAGIDILQSDRGPLVMEINSSPGLKGIETITGINIADKIVEFIEKSLLK